MTFKEFLVNRFWHIRQGFKWHVFGSWYLAIMASTAIGAISFFGTVAFFTPLVPLPIILGIISIVATVLYETQVYKQTVRAGWHAFNRHALMKKHFARDVLLELAADKEKRQKSQFLKDYAEALAVLQQFELDDNEELDEESTLRKKAANKLVRRMESMFAHLAFDSVESDLSAYESEIDSLIGIEKYKYRSKLKNAREQLGTFQRLNRYAKAFTCGMALFAMIGMFVLLMPHMSTIVVGGIALFHLGAFVAPTAISVISFASLAVFSVSSGIAYALLTHSALTGLIQNNTFKQLFTICKNYYDDNRYVVGTAMGILTLLVVGLAVAMTVFTGGTWWSLIHSTLAQWMFRGLAITISVINLSFWSLSSFFFYIENSKETIGNLTSLFEHPIKSLVSYFVGVWIELKTTFKSEHFLQFINPFRFIVKIASSSLNVIGFIIHVGGDGLIADRFPGVPQQFTGSIGTIVAGMAEAHFFFGGHKHKTHNAADKQLSSEEQSEEQSEKLSEKQLQHRHDHAVEHAISAHAHDHGNIPTYVIALILSPLTLASTIWDWTFSKLNDANPKKGKPRQLSFFEACKRNFALTEYKSVEANFNALDKNSINHIAAESARRLEHKLGKARVSTYSAVEKMSELRQFQTELKGLNTKQVAQGAESNGYKEIIANKVNQMKNKQSKISQGRINLFSNTAKSAKKIQALNDNITLMRPSA